MIKRLLSTVDKWGPLLVSVIALSILMVVGWWYSERIAKLEGQVLVLQDVNENVLMWQAHSMVLSKRMLEHGIAVPDPPQLKLKHNHPKKEK